MAWATDSSFRQSSPIWTQPSIHTCGAPPSLDLGYGLAHFNKAVQFGQDSVHTPVVHPWATPCAVCALPGPCGQQGDKGEADGGVQADPTARAA